MKKQDTSSLRSSSYRQENSPKNLQAQSIGCMSSIFHLIYKYNNRRRGKFITSGKKQQKESNSNINAVGNCNNNVTRLTCDVPRSPTLPSEIRRGNSMETDAEMSFLEEAAEKRRKLIEAVEKCDEDLKELKKIIDVVKNSVSVDNQVDLEPSPVSVLDDFTPLPSVLSSPSSYARRYANGRAVVVEEQERVQKQKRKAGDDDDEESNISLVEKMKMKSERRLIINQGKRSWENLIISPPIMWGSKAMVESVNQVCGDIEWGERREIGRLGLALQHFIFRDLIDDFVLELVSFSLYSLPFQSCRRSLRFY